MSCFVGTESVAEQLIDAGRFLPTWDLFYHALGSALPTPVTSHRVFALLTRSSVFLVDVIVCFSTFATINENALRARDSNPGPNTLKG